jgi:hypothetical protein
MAIWVKPADDTALLEEANQGVHGMDRKRNDVIFPPHGSTFGEGDNAGCGLAVGRNGVVVFEHGANYFAPVLVHAAPIDGWTHVAVSYRDGQPSLFLNGVLARKGLKSSHTVHCGAAAQGGGDAHYRGKLGTFELVGHPLNETESAQWAKTMPVPGLHTAARAMELTRDARGGIQAEVWQTGSYELKYANENTAGNLAVAVPSPVELPGGWEVRFKPGMGAPEKASFDALVDWTQRPEDSIRHFSGSAVYRKSFDMPFQPLKNNRVLLDLGEVRDFATVRLNGHALGTLWNAPWTLDVTSAVRAENNVLEVEVVNAWNNRLVGDAKLPSVQRHTFLLAPTVSRESPLMPAGLLGPVTLRMSVLVNVKTGG